MYKMRFTIVLLVTLGALSGCNTLLPTRPDIPAADTATTTAPPASSTQAAVEPQAEPPAPVADATPAPAGSAAAAAVQSDVSAVPAPAAAPQPPEDLWSRIRAGYQLPDRDNPRVAAELKWYADHGEYLDRVMERAEPFLQLIVDKVQKRGMPTELALLPVVESAFQPFAYSHGRAAGMWQFIPSTGRLYGLKQNWWYDGRRDVLASTDAALDYLEKLHAQFNGDWLLALAAYNSGEGTVQRAIRYNERRHIPTTFWNLRLPRETQGYAPKLLAIAEIVAHPKKYGITLREIPDRRQVAKVDVGSQIDLALAAKMAGISVEEMYRLNPGFNRWATDPNGPFHLLVPADAKQQFEEKLAQLPKSKRIRWQRHRIARGESLIRIARNFHTTPQLLRKVNHMSSNRIVAGDHLIIPVASLSLSRYELSADQRRKSLLKAGSPASRAIHVVKSGDTFWDLSRQYGVSMQRLAKWNGMSPHDPLHPGQKLVIHGAPARFLRVSSAPLAAMVRPIKYIVRSGDSLAAIAQRFRVTVAQLCHWNRLDEDNYLQPGQRLTLYVDVTQQSS